MNAVPGGFFVKEAIDHIDLVLDRFQRFKGLLQLHRSAVTFRSPVVFIHSVSHKENGESLRKSRIGRGRGRCERFEPWESHHCSGSAEDGSTIDLDYLTVGG